MRPCAYDRSQQKAGVDITSYARAMQPSTTLLVLPDDLLLEIFARSDVVSIVRCAATCRALRRCILEEDFRRRRLALRAEANGGFDADLLLGISYMIHTFRRVDVGCTLHTPPSIRPLSFDASLLKSFEPVVSRHGLVVLKQLFDLCVCNAFTGNVTPFLPAMEVDSREIYPPALLAVADAGRSFELLVLDRGLQTQTFSSKDGRWSAVRTAHLASGHLPPLAPLRGSFPAVAGRVVHWLGLTEQNWELGAHAVVIFALHADEAEARTIKLPPGCADRMLGCVKSTEELLLAAPADGTTALRLVVAEREVLSVWTLLPPSSETEAAASVRWSRQVVIARQAIDPQLPSRDAYYSVRFLGFGERSGAVLLDMRLIGLVQLNLGTNKVVVLRRARSSEEDYSDMFSRLCLHEIDLDALLQAMKPLPAP